MKHSLNVITGDYLLARLDLNFFFRLISEKIFDALPLHLIRSFYDVHKIRQEKLLHASEIVSCQGITFR